MSLPRHIAGFALAAISLTMAMANRVKAEDISPLVSGIANEFSAQAMAACLLKFDKSGLGPNKILMDTLGDQKTHYIRSDTGTFSCGRDDEYADAQDKNPERSCGFVSKEKKASINVTPGSKQEYRAGALQYPDGVINFRNLPFDYAYDGGANGAYFFNRDNLASRIPARIIHSDENGIITPESLGQDATEAAKHNYPPVPSSFRIPTVPEYDLLFKTLKNAVAVCDGPVS